MPVKKTITASFERLEFPNRDRWRKWLQQNHAASPGVWLVYYKKGSGKPSVAYGDAVEEALCFGWIDTTVKSVDTERYMQLFTPRRPKSTWSKSNKERVDRLIAQKLMTAAGVEKIAAAKRDGSWSQLDTVEALKIPADFREALAANKQAQQNFRRLTDGKKKVLLYRIHGAKRPETRGKRIQEIIALVAENRII